jgi:hypothetical protein
MRGPRSYQRQTRGATRFLLCALFLLAVGTSTTVAKEDHNAMVFLARPDGPGGRLVGFDTVTGAVRFTLPPGLTSADGQRYFSARASDGETTIDAYFPSNGQWAERIIIHGAWELHGVSATGTWLGLRRIPTDAELAAWQDGDDMETEIAIVDTISWRIAHEIRLDGNFDIDGLSRDGASLFLLQHVDATDATHYQIRLYDLTTDSLFPEPLRDKRAPDEEMTGYAWDGTASPDGQWLLTLYLNNRNNTAFVHSLNLANRYPVCIDLPSADGDMAKLRAYTITMAPDGMHAYAANPVLGRLAVLDLGSWTVDRVVTFPAVTPIPADERATGRSLLSPDRRTLYFTAGRIVWAYNTNSGAVDHSYQAPVSVIGLGLSEDGGRLLIAGGDGKVTAVDLASGASVVLSRT